MIKSKLIFNKKDIPVVTQRIMIICDDCDKEFDLYLYSQIKGLNKYGRDLCRGCKQREQIKLGIRGKQYINVAIINRNRTLGKTLEEMYGNEKALKLKQNLSNYNKGENNNNYGGVWYGNNPGFNQKGKTIEEIHGEKKAKEIKEKLSKASSGENNPMFGKPSPQGSGNGWSGWYNNWYFRSLKELSFMINVIERFNFKWENGELKKHKISYVDYKGNNRNYFSDFILNGKYMIEIKPKKLHNTPLNKIKKEYAMIYCEKNNLKYKLLSPIKNLSYDELKVLVDESKIKFLDRYKIKFEQWKKD